MKKRASMTQPDACPSCDQEVAGLITIRWQHSFIQTDQKIFSLFILSLPLIQDGQLSVSGERMYTNTG